jgi:CDGSH-type Zn-finger protein
MKWTVPKTQDAYYLCACKQTKNEPLCDGNHKNAKEVLGEQAVKCEDKNNHNKNCALCTRCGWNPNLEF